MQKEATQTHTHTQTNTHTHRHTPTEREAAVILRAKSLEISTLRAVLVRVCPKEVANQAGVWNVGGADDPLHLRN